MNESEKKLQTTSQWQEALKSVMPLLGHRNWIVVTDMAYPLQSKDAITTLYADEPYIEVVKEIKNILSESPHVTPQIYQDRELSFMNDGICPGIDELKQDVSAALSPLKSTMRPHEELISILDSTAEVFKIVIIKTNLTKPYTTLFFRLDCKYWNADKQQMLDKIMAGNK